VGSGDLELIQGISANLGSTEKGSNRDKACFLALRLDTQDYCKPALHGNGGGWGQMENVHNGLGTLA
jgi:hypothetical protein